jgi:hypothetical protein
LKLTVHTGFTASDPDCDDEPLTNGVDRNPKPVAYRTIISAPVDRVGFPVFRPRSTAI